MKNLICYFSATGNTERVVDIFQKELIRQGQEVSRFRVFAGATPPSELMSVDQIIVAFPVLAMMAPVMMGRFLRRLPSGQRSNGTAVRAVVLAVAGGDGGPAAVRTGAILRRRGYRLVMSARLNYPENWSQVGAVPKNEADAAAKLASGDQAARALAAKLVAGTGELDRTSVGLSIMGRVLSALFGMVGRRFLGKLFTADERCTSCGLCAESCPAAAIVLRKGKGQRPYWKMSCENCNRCVNTCPRGAITSSILNAVLQLASVGILLAAGILVTNRSIWPIVAPFLPGALGSALHAALIIVVIIASHYLSFGLLDYLLYRWIRQMPGLKAAFARGFMGGARRYVAPGFVPQRRGQ